jgi:hypothetical protein
MAISSTPDAGTDTPDSTQSADLVTARVVDLSKLPLLHHEPLDLSKPAIRLLDVLPREGRSEIRCRIKQVVLSASGSEPQFTALSYVWGNPNGPRHSVVINDRRYNVLENLYRFLDLHGVRGINNVFVDALCIAQDDKDEKNHQVLLMKDIYRRAAKVIAWLGPAEGRSDELFDLLNELEFVELREESGYFHVLSSEPDFQVQRRLIKREQMVARAATNLCQRGYWTRAWIVQEIVLARQLELVCGTKRLPWIAWIYFLNTVVGLRGGSSFQSLPDSLFVRSIKGSMMYTVCKKWYSPRRPATTRNLVTKFAKSECLLQHDKVYAFLGLASDAEKIQVNYDTPVELLLVNVLLLDMKTTEKNDILALCAAFSMSPALLTLAFDMHKNKTRFPPSLEVRTLAQTLLTSCETTGSPTSIQIYRYGRTLPPELNMPDATISGTSACGISCNSPGGEKRSYQRRTFTSKWDGIQGVSELGHLLACFCARCQKSRSGYAEMLVKLWNTSISADYIAPATYGTWDSGLKLFFRGDRYICSAVPVHDADKRKNTIWTLFHDPPSCLRRHSVYNPKRSEFSMSMRQLVNVLSHQLPQHGWDHSIGTIDHIVGRPLVPLRTLRKVFVDRGSCTPPDNVPLNRFPEYFRYQQRSFSLPSNCLGAASASGLQWEERRRPRRPTELETRVGFPTSEAWNHFAFLGLSVLPFTHIDRESLLELF